MSHRILLAEADPELAGSIADGLTRERFGVEIVSSVGAALAAIDHQLPDVGVLAFDLPGPTGLELLRALRAGLATRRLPLVVLGPGGREVDMALSFEFGADDFMGKPPSLRELCLRVRALMRRVDDREVPGPQPRNEVAGLRLDAVSGRAWVDGREVSLTLTEHRVLNRLVSKGSQVLSRETLLQEVWQGQPDLNTRRVDTVIARLRRKLGRVGRLIETVRGHGYRFRTPTGTLDGAASKTSRLMA